MKKLFFHRDVPKLFRNSNPLKNLTVGLVKKSGGRNHHGRITVAHRGGGHRKVYRVLQQPAIGEWIILAIEYDPNRTAWIALIQNSKQAVAGEKGGKQYVLLTDQLSVGDTFKSFEQHIAEEDQETGFFERRSYGIGDRVPLWRLTVGSQVHSVQVDGKKESMIARAAGTYCLVVAKRMDENQVLLKYPSGKSFWITGDYYGTVGQVCNSDHATRRYHKAGVIRWLGIRPTVRGVAMNPVDHPHGGGHGSKGGRPSSTPWGRLTKGKPTSKIRRKKQ